MDKLFIDKTKNNSAEEKETGVSTIPAAGEAVSPAIDPPSLTAASPENAPTIGAYGPQATRPLITKDAYKEIDSHKPWMDDPKTRLGIRLFSRGVLGAAFFAGGSLLTTKWMRGATHDPALVGTTYNAGASFAEQKNPLQFIAKLIDTVVGKPIEAAVTATMGAKAGASAVRFRPTQFERWGAGALRGRSLGDEAVSITFDFFCASVGDALGRDIAGWFDPNVKKTWTDDKGNIQIPKAIDATLKAVTRYATYNGGEDIAVAIPYAYFMKAQRSLINKHSPGFQYDFDRGIHGASFKVANNKIVGNFNLEGMIDLQSRFTAYNVGTLMYREAYDYVQNKIAGKPDSLYGAQDKEPQKGLLGKAGDLMKWAARSAIKGAIIMTPAVPFFWITRTTQNKNLGAFIDPEKGILSLPGDNTGINAYKKAFSPDQKLELRKYNRLTQLDNFGVYDNFSSGTPIAAAQFEPSLTQPHPSNPKLSAFNPFGNTHGIVDSALNSVGKKAYGVSRWLDTPAAWVDSTKSFGKNVNKAFAIGEFGNFTRPMLKASLSYTPYMYAKTEFANLWDNGRMDMAAERMIDGAAGFNWKDFSGGAYEVLNAVLHKPLEDPAREAEAHRRDLIDTSPPDIFHTTQAGMEKETIQARIEAERKEKPKENLSWQERVISAKPEPKTALQKQTVAAHVPPPKKHADQEAMRKALEELKPPTNSIN